jgi:hypothetical protein
LAKILEHSFTDELEVLKKEIAAHRKLVAATEAAARSAK